MENALLIFLINILSLVAFIILAQFLYIQAILIKLICYSFFPTGINENLKIETSKKLKKLIKSLSFIVLYFLFINYAFLTGFLAGSTESTKCGFYKSTEINTGIKILNDLEAKNCELKNNKPL